MATLGHVRAADRLPDSAPPPPAHLDPTLIAGTWYATDPAADGIVRLVLAGADGRLEVQAFGAGIDEPLDWGTVAATAYGSGVAAREVMAFSAEYRFPFAIVLLAAYAKQGILVLDTFTTFTDSAGRANYFSREFFHR